MENMLVIALPKGRLLDPSILFLKQLGLSPKGLTETSRRLIYDDEHNGVRVLLVRAVDIATYVEYGAADMGIAGKDLLLEQMRDVYEPVDLAYGPCKVVLAQAESEEKKEGFVVKGKASSHTKLRIATKYPNITERFFLDKGIPIEIVKLYGSIELAPLVGLADQIVDLSSSGETLRAHHLSVVEEIVQSSARLIVNRASLRLKYPRIQDMIDTIKQAVKK